VVTDPRDERQRARSDRSPWNWLLLLPLVVTLWPPLFNRRDPELFSIPFFYWYQLATVVVGVGCTVLVYRRTRG
jgi:hypothetical protein